MGAGKSGLDYVLWMSEAGGEHFGFEVVLFEDLDHFGDYGHAVVPRIIQPADEGAYIGCSGQGPEEGLVDGEGEGLVYGYTLAGEYGDDLQAFFSNGDLHHDVGGPGGNLSSLFDHVLGVEAKYLGVDRAIDQGTDFDNGGAQIQVPGLRGEGWVSGHAGDDAELGGFPNLFYVCGVKPNLHSCITIYSKLTVKPPC